MAVFNAIVVHYTGGPYTDYHMLMLHGFQHLLKIVYLEN